jgi:glycosyltransferase involved in cell wall biosynthesis
MDGAIKSPVNTAQNINLVLLYCGIRTGHFGMGSHSRHIIDYFKNQPGYSVTILKVDSKDVALMRHYHEGGVEVVEIPQPENQLFLTEEDTLVQNTYAKRICEMAFPFLRSKENTILLCNIVVHIGLAREMKQALGAGLVYIHHNFIWKAYLKTSYAFFAEQWLRGNARLHPGAFVGTANQLKIADMSDKVVTVTHQAENFFSDILHIPSQKIKTIYNGISSETKNARVNRIELRKKYGFCDTDRIILFCGRIAEEKGLPYIIEAFKFLVKKMPDARLLVVGDGQIQESLALVNPFWSRVNFTGKLDYNTITEMYAIADVGVMPSTQEQCSITSIEMRFHKLPMIVSAVEGLDEMFEDGFDALKLPVKYDENSIIYFSVEDLYERLLILLEDDTLSSILAENAWLKGMKKFTSERMTNEYDKVFRSLFANHKI